MMFVAGWIVGLFMGGALVPMLVVELKDRYDIRPIKTLAALLALCAALMGVVFLWPV